MQYQSIRQFTNVELVKLRNTVSALVKEPSIIRIWESLLESASMRREYLDMVGDSEIALVSIGRQADVFPGKRQFQKLKDLGLIGFYPVRREGSRLVYIQWNRIAKLAGI